MNSTVPESERMEGEPQSEQQRRIAALRLAGQGRVYELASGWWRGMPCHPVHPRFEVLTYRSPRGERNQRDLEFLDESVNTAGYGFVSDLILGSTHTGTHIDAPCHVTAGSRMEWHGGESADQMLGDFGALSGDASGFPPLVARGILLDIPQVLGCEVLPAHHAITEQELRSAARQARVAPQPGTVALVRTGQMKYWPDEEAMSRSEGCGVSLEGARWLQQQGVIAVGADTDSFEVSPTQRPGVPQPVHLFLVHDAGIPILELVNCEELAADKIAEFLFLALPLTIRGATGSLIRPIAMA